MDREKPLAADRAGDAGGQCRRRGRDRAAVLPEIDHRADRRPETLQPAAPGRPRHLHPRRLLQLPLADDTSVPRRDRALRPLFGGRRVGLRPAVPVGFQAHLARVGGRYSDEWHKTHLNNPRDVVPESNMPNYPWLARTNLDPQAIVPHLRALQRLGDPYTDAEIVAAPEQLKDKTEEDALIAYLQGLGIQIKTRN